MDPSCSLVNSSSSSSSSTSNRKNPFENNNKNSNSNSNKSSSDLNFLEQKQQQKQEEEEVTGFVSSLDLESVPSGVSSVSNEVSSLGAGGGNNKKKESYSYFQQRVGGVGSVSSVMDSATAAHSRKHASRLAVPAGTDFSSAAGNNKSSSASLTGIGVSVSSSFSTTATTTPTLTLSAWQYWSRLTDLRQMDMQSALDQMKTLLSTRPQVVYKTSYYRKQTKNHWARDDPAFLFLQALFLVIAAVAYSVAFRISILGSVSFLLYTVVWNWMGMGILLATLCREIANRQLVGQQTATSNSHVRQHVEWLYAFDIHCNSFFPVFVVLYGVQFFLLPLVLGEGWFPLILANSLYAASLSWYWYITHLGYRSLPFLGNTEVFLFPIAAIGLIYILSLAGYPFGFGWNAARVMARFYFM